MWSQRSIDFGCSLKAQFVGMPSMAKIHIGSGWQSWMEGIPTPTLTRVRILESPIVVAVDIGMNHLSALCYWDRYSRIDNRGNGLPRPQCSGRQTWMAA